ncbi:band 4.1-like protein 4 isoform X2 [Aethina tumida]|uniref:band 4.1-like protein 4 isoform X2 n=1 Tax=Aethina tumida TaxID=116153 RepID=UPI0021485A6C|nr:band 4.1-like protein 4 isoform X2 [Aethina tumida]
MMDCFCSKPISVHCKIVFLDETELVHELQNNSPGQALLDIVFRHLNLLETAYFGLRYLDLNGQTHWLDPTKKLNKQIKGPDPYTLYFGVKFYAADPCKLLEEITRYQFFLQIKQDILQGRLLVPFELAAELGAYILQSELGDYDPRRHSPGYVSEFRFLPNQSVELEMRIAELHQTLVGQLPSSAELNYLDKVKWLENYGVDLHPVLGEDHVEYFLGLTPSGIIVLRNKNTVGNYYWPRITKIYFKGRYFMLRVTDKNNDECTYGFETPSKSACKHLWKCCVEHHAFFRLVQVTPASPDIFALGSRFRYSEKQAVRDAQMKMRSPPTFSRTPSRKFQRRPGGSNNEPPQPVESTISSQFHPQEVKHISLPLPVENFENVGYSSSNAKKFDSPRSTRSAPWSQPHSKGLYNSSSVPPSPRSVRSGRFRSSSVDSQSSNDSRSCKKRRHRSRTSDNESELSKGSSRSRRKHRRRRSKSKRDSGSEYESSRSHERRSSRSKSNNYYELVDSQNQWQEIQKNSEHSGIQQANVVRSSKSHDRRSNSTDTYNNRQHKHRKHRSRSRSPGDSNKTWMTDELKKHLEFDLVETNGMSDLQLREIPYTTVQSNFSKHVKLKPGNINKMDEKMRSNNHSPYLNQYLDKNPLYNQHHSYLNEALTNFSYPEDTNSNSLIGLPDPLQPSSYYNGNINGVYNNSIHDNIGYHRNHHEHSDSGLGIEQELDLKKGMQKII